MTKAEYLVQRAKEFGVEPWYWDDQPHHFQNFDAASDFEFQANLFTGRMASVLSKIQKEDKRVNRAIFEIEKALPVERKKAIQAQKEMRAILSEVELAGCLERFQKLNLSTDDPYFNLKFTFQHHLDLAKPFIEDLYEGDIDSEKVITDPNYLDELIFKDPKAVYVRGLLFMVAEGAYEQHVQSTDVMSFIVNNPTIPDHSVKFFLVQQADVDNNTYFKERLATYVDVLRKHRDDNALIDDRTNGHHLHYFLLPTCNVHNQLIEIYGCDKDGNIFTDDEVKAFVKTLDSRPFLKVDFGYKSLIRLTEPFLKYQEKTGKIGNELIMYRDYESLVETYEKMTSPGM